MCKEKGLDTLVDAYLLLKKRSIGDNVRLHVGGGCGPTDGPFVEEQRRKLHQAGMLGSVKFFPNVDHAGKIAFYRGLTVFSTPACFGEAFGLYLLEALAAGVPVVQPRHAAFPELVEATGGGILCEPNDPKSLADGIERLLTMRDQASLFGQRGREAVAKHFTIEVMARNIIEAFRPLLVSTAS
jgi:glycosyltransferase involved in cell wall biosynthesis